jgi:hypothetical protein
VSVALLVWAARLGAQPGVGVRVEAGETSRDLSAAQLLSLPQDTIRARAHDGPERAFVGPRLSAVLRLAGAPVDSLRGRALAQYVLVEARDGYRVVFAAAELNEAFTGRRIILAHSADGQAIPADAGPWQVIVEGELRPARWIRQVTSIRLSAAPSAR